jgi:hypothetical protein
MALAGRIAKMFTKSEVEKMDKAAKKFSGSPGYDEDTAMAQKEYAKEKAVDKSKKLSAAEEKAADKEAYASAMGKEKTAPKGKMSEKEKKDLQESLNFKKGGSVKKMAKGGSVKAANCGASVKPAFACGGMVKKGKK